MFDAFIQELKTIGIFLASFLGIDIIEYDRDIRKWQAFESKNANVIFRIPKITGKIFFFAEDPHHSKESQGVFGFFTLQAHVIFLAKLHKSYNIGHNDIPRVLVRCTEKSFKTNLDLFNALQEKLQKEEKETGKHHTIAKIETIKLWGKNVWQVGISELPEQSFYMFTTPLKSYLIGKNLGNHSDKAIKEGIEQTLEHLEFTS